MRLPWGLKWLCAHRWRQTSAPRLSPGPFHREWVCLSCRKRALFNITQPPVIFLLPGEPEAGRPNPYDEVLAL